MKQRLQGLVIGLIISIFLSGTISYAATATKQFTAYLNNIKFVIDGVATIPKDEKNKAVQPFTVNGTTYMPVDSLSKALGREVTWDANAQTYYIGKKDPIRLVINGTVTTLKDSAGNSIRPFMMNGAACVSIDALSRALGKKVSYNATTQTVTIRENTFKWLDELGAYQSASSVGRSYTESFGAVSDDNRNFERAVKFNQGANQDELNQNNHFEITSNEYLLNGQYKQFIGTIFSTRDNGGEPSIIKMYGDNNLLYTSPGVSSNTKPLDINLDLNGVKIFRIEVATKADWQIDKNIFIGNAKLYYDTPTDLKPVAVKSTKWLDELGAYQAASTIGRSYTEAYGSVSDDNRNFERALKFIQSANHEELSQHNNAEITSVDYLLGSQYKQFTGSIFCTRENGGQPSIIRMYGDNNLLYSSPGVSSSTKPLDITLDLNGVKVFRIEVETKDSYQIDKNIFIGNAKLAK